MSAPLKAIQGGQAEVTELFGTPRRRIGLLVKDGVRVVLELDEPGLPEITRRMVRHIDRVRALLVAGRICPDDAHAMLLDCRWVNRP